MRVREALAIILESVHEITDSYGSPSDRPKVRAYLAKPLSVPYETYLYVGRIPVANFYALASHQFDKGSLWQEVQDRSEKRALSQPKKWGIESTLIELALWVHSEGSSE